MFKLFAICACVVAICAVVISQSHGNSPTEYIGQMPLVVVTAPRYDGASESYGLMDTVVISAERLDSEDAAWSGLLDTVTAIRMPAQSLPGLATPTLTYQGPLHIIIDGYHRWVE